MLVNADLFLVYKISEVGLRYTCYVRQSTNDEDDDDDHDS